MGGFFMLPVVDAAKDGSETRPNGLYPSGTGITRSSNERPSSATPRPVNPSFSAQRAKQLRPVSAHRRISPITLDSVKVERCCRSDSIMPTPTAQRPLHRLHLQHPAWLPAYAMRQPYT